MVQTPGSIARLGILGEGRDAEGKECRHERQRTLETPIRNDFHLSGSQATYKYNGYDGEEEDCLTWSAWVRWNRKSRGRTPDLHFLVWMSLPPTSVQSGLRLRWLVFA